MQPATGARAGGAVRRVSERPLAGLAIAALGVAIGHELTYTILLPNPVARAAMLASTGHAYFSVFAQSALVLGAIGAAAAILGALGRDGGGAPLALARLARLQVVAFVWMELVERVVSRAGLGAFVGADIAVGVFVQALVAFLLWWLLSVLIRAACAVVGTGAARSPRPVAFVPAAPTARPPASAPRLQPPSRAPPSESSSLVA